MTRHVQVVSKQSEAISPAIFSARGGFLFDSSRNGIPTLFSRHRQSRYRRNSYRTEGELTLSIMLADFDPKYPSTRAYFPSKDFSRHRRFESAPLQRAVRQSAEGIVAGSAPRTVGVTVERLVAADAGAILQRAHPPIGSGRRDSAAE